MSIYEQIRDIPSFCKVNKLGKVYLRYVDSPFDQYHDRKGIVYVGTALEDGRMMTDDRFFRFCEINEEVKAFEKEQAERLERERQAYLEEQRRKKEEEDRIRFENTVQQISPVTSIIQERLYQRTGVKELLSSLYGEVLSADLRTMGTNFAYHRSKAFVDHTGMYGVYYPLERFPFLRANATVEILNEVGAQGTDAFYEGLLQKRRSDRLAVMPFIMSLEIYDSGERPRDMFGIFNRLDNPLRSGTMFYEHRLIFFDREDGIPVYMCRDENNLWKIAEKPVDDCLQTLPLPLKEAVQVGTPYDWRMYHGAKELHQRGRKFATPVPFWDSAFASPFREFHDSLMEDGPKTAYDARTVSMPYEMDGVPGKLLIACRTGIRKKEISNMKDNLAWTKRRLEYCGRGEAENIENAHLYTINYDEEGFPMEVHLVKNGQRQFQYEAGFFAMFTNDPEIPDEELVRWYLTGDELVVDMIRSMNLAEGDDITETFDKEAMKLVYFLSFMTAVESRRLLGNAMPDEYSIFKKAEDTLGGISVELKGDQASFSSYALDGIKKNAYLLKAAGITKKDLLNYALEVRKVRDYFPDEHDEDDALDW